MIIIDLGPEIQEEDHIASRKMCCHPGLVGKMKQSRHCIWRSRRKRGKSTDVKRKKSVIVVEGGAGLDPDQGEGVEREGREEIEPDHVNAVDAGLTMIAGVDNLIEEETAEGGAAIDAVMNDTIMKLNR